MKEWDAVSGVSGSWPEATISWGEHRIWITPIAGQNYYNRGNFSIHGGLFAGSAFYRFFYLFLASQFYFLLNCFFALLKTKMFEVLR